MDFPPDFGPLYTETNLSNFPVEPWNTFSNLIFLFVIIYFSAVTKFDYKRFPLTVIALPLLGVGFIGGTVFHATRAHRIWLIMDWGPIVLLSLLASVYFIRLITGSRIIALSVPVFFFEFFRALLKIAELPIGVRISVGYTSLAALILVPAYLASRRYAAPRSELLYSALIFSAAVSFRYLDPLQLLPMGTHFLWHILGGVSVWFLMRYITTLELEVAGTRQNQL